MMNPTQLQLRWLLVLVVQWGGLTTTNIAFAGWQDPPIAGVTVGYEGVELANQGYCASSPRTWNDSVCFRPDASAFFGPSSEFYAAKTAGSGVDDLLHPGGNLIVP
jgi:hypothetical protein